MGTIGTAFKIGLILMQLARFFMERAGKRETAEALKNEILNLQGGRFTSARDARDDVASGRVPGDPRYQRD